jgi:hypothetical protein
MTEDEQIRLAGTAIAAAAVPFLKAHLYAKLAAKKAETGRSLPERIGYRLGSLWARRQQRS